MNQLEERSLFIEIILKEMANYGRSFNEPTRRKESLFRRIILKDMADQQQKYQ